MCWLLTDKTKTVGKKSAQSNLGRGPRRGAVTHVRRKVPVGYSGAPQICPQKYPFPCTDRQTPLLASSLCRGVGGFNPALVEDDPHTGD